MNLKIKCDTPKEQVLVLRKFKKLVPECKWGFCDDLFDMIPFIEKGLDKSFIIIHDNGCVTYCPENQNYYDKYPTFNASEFLREDWKLKSEKSEDEALFLEIQKAVENFNKSLRELEESLRAKYKP